MLCQLQVGTALVFSGLFVGLALLLKALLVRGQLCELLLPYRLFFLKALFLARHHNLGVRHGGRDVRRLSRVWDRSPRRDA